ncbi:MAG TPA: hypothetical protein VNI83_01175 [Vicinamibacterales bacterium]|nr:hypothetical protein [Vicinamibacterales bacterium]
MLAASIARPGATAGDPRLPPGAARQEAAVRQTTKPPAAVPRVLDLDGRRVDPLDAAAVATVLVFDRIDCPISNRYAPDLRRLHERFAPRGVRFRLVYPGRDVQPMDIRRHLKEFAYPADALRDPEFALVDLTGARVTPEAAVFRGRTLVYRGRIDDRYISPGRMRPAPRRRDLEEALEALLVGRPVPAPGGPAVGCLIDDLR